jgi:CRP-like cAMP-binding protein
MYVYTMNSLGTAKNIILFGQIPIVKEIGFTPNELSVFEQYVTLKKFDKKEKILCIGEEESSFRMVQKGLIREYYIFNNQEINIQFAEKDNIVCSYSSYMSNQPSAYCIEAVEPSVVFSIKREWMDLVMTKGLKFLQFGKKISATITRQKELREMELLNYDALGRLQHFRDSKPDLFLRLPQTYIASYLNLSPETFSTLKKKLR